MSSVHNLNNTSAGAPGASNLFVSRRAKAAPRFEPGERIFAIIQEKDASKAILNAENRGFSFELLAHEIIGEAGDRVSFEVISHNKNGLALRQIHATDNMAGRAVKHGKLKSLKDLMAENELTECTVSPLDYKELAETAEEKRAKEARALTIIRRNAGSAANSAGQAAVRALIAEGVDINKLDLSSLSTMITAISRDGLIEPPSASADPESLLRELDIPATRRNIAALEGIMSAIDAAKGIEPRAAAALIAREDDPTLENIYKYATAAPSTETEDIDGLDGMIEGLFAREGIENNSENMEAARLLITEGAELTAENLGLFKALMSIKDAENAGEPGDFIAQSLMLKALLLMKRGENPYNSSLRKPDIKPMDRTEFRRLAEDVRVIKADHIETALMKGLPATIQDLARLAASGETYGGAKNNAAKPHSAIRLQMEALAEINLRLTYEAANRLYQKNIRIDLLTLTGAVDALKAAEREGYEARLKALDIPASPENIDQVAEIIDAARAAGRVPDWGYGEIMSARVAFTMRSVASLAPAVTTSETALSVSARYAVFEASPSRRYGDGLKDARERYSRLLESLGFEATNANIKAARILGANNMDLSAENISAVKALDAKLTDISGRLHPMIAASMLKDKLNPLDMDIDDTLEYIKAFGEEYGETPDDALARHIYAMEKSGKLDEESREALVAVYKMLHIIQNDGKGLGAAVRSGEPLTLGRLLELTEARKVKVNLVAGDNKRHRAYKTAGRNIREILERSERPDNDEWYAARVMEGLARTAKPEALAETLSKENIYEMPIETALEYVAEANEQLAPEDDIRQAEQLAAAVQSLEDVPAAYIKRMTDSGIPPRFIDIIAFKNLMGGRPPGDELEGLKNKRFKEKIDGADLKNAAKGFDGYIESVCEAIKDAAELGGGETERVNAALRAIRLRYGASGGMDAYYLPVKLNDKITDVDMYIIGDNLDEKEQVRLVMMLRTAAGAVDMRLDMDGQGFSVSATAEGSDLDAEGGLTADLDAVYNGLREEGWEHEAIKPGTLPERLRAMASAMLKFLERN